MPYISSEKVKEIRTAIKAQFPNCKFSITNDNHSTVCVAIMESPIDFGFEHKQLNHKWMKDHGYSEEVVLFVAKIVEIINSKEEQRELTYDSDYGSVPTFYINVHVGKWDKAYKQVIK